MAKLKITPLLAVRPVNVQSMSDRSTVVYYDAGIGVVRIAIGTGEASITATWDATSQRWRSINAYIDASASSTTAARVNRLLTGTGASRIEGYHRTGKLAVNTRGHRLALPATIDLKLNDNGMYDESVSGAQHLAAPATVAAPATPVQGAAAAIITPCQIHGLMHADAKCPRHAQFTPNAPLTPLPAWATPSAAPVVTSMPVVCRVHGGLSHIDADCPRHQPESITPIEIPSAEEIAEAIIEANASMIAPPEEIIPEVSYPTEVPTEQVTADAPVKVAPSAQHDPAGLMVYPSRNATERIEVSALNRTMLEAYWQKHIAGDQSIVSIVGPSGTGKTSLIWDLAADKQVGLFMFDAAGASSFTDWTGTTVLKQGEGTPVTEFITSSFIEFARIDGPYAGQPRLGGIDELNRAETGGALNAMLPILAQGRLFIPELGETIVFDPAVFWVFTMNRGSVYNATLTLDAALADRVQAWVMLDNLTPEQETTLLMKRTGIDRQTAGRLVDVAQKVRDIANRGELDKGISIRRTLDAARAVKAGLTLSQACTFCWANSYLDEGGKESDRGRVLTTIGATLGEATVDTTEW